MKILAAKRTRPVIPIIALIDILAILLIFFIVSTTFREKQSLLNINLPTAGSLAAESSSESRLVLAATAEGELFLQDQPVTIDDLPVKLAELKLAQPAAKLALEADTKTDLGLLLSIWDALTTAGFEVKEVPARILVGEK